MAYLSARHRTGRVQASVRIKGMPTQPCAFDSAGYLAHLRTLRGKLPDLAHELQDAQLHDAGRTAAAT
eukprot:1519302-Rhodomonas_salina.2